jgi:3-hydroxyisobutyryl-CoA hydrolase
MCTYVVYQSTNPSKYSLFLSQRLLLLEESLKKLDTSNTSDVCGTIDQFAQQPSLKENSSLYR